MKKCALICGFNEEKTARDVILRTLKYVDKVIFVNDGSTDNTLEIVESNFSGDKKVRILSWDKNRGKGYAIIQGFKEFLKSNGDILVTIDADGQHDPANIPNLILPLRSGYVDLVIGTRIGKNVIYPRKRVFFNVLTSIAVLLTTGGFYPDVASGFRAFTRKAIEKTLPHLETYDFSIELEILKVIQERGGVGIASVPVTCNEPKKANFGRIARAYMGFAWRHKADIFKRILIRK